MLIKILMVLLMVSMVHTEWRWADDTTEFAMDKQAHFTGSFGLYFMFRYKNFSELDSFKYTLYCGLSKELIDAYLSSEKNGKWGGDGFSKYDLGYDMLGILCAYGLDKIWKPKEKANVFRVGLNHNSLNFSFKFH